MSDQQQDLQVRAELDEKAKRVREKDVQRVASQLERFERKLGKVPRRLDFFIRQVKLLFELIRAYASGSYREIPYMSIAMAVTAMVYFLSPLDGILDVIPVLGYVDDASVVGLAVMAIQDDLRAYCVAMGYDPAEYFG